MGGTKTETLLMLLLFFFAYVLFLNTFSFISGSPSLFSDTCKSGISMSSVINDDNCVSGLSKFASLTGFGDYGDIPTPLTFLVSFVWLTLIGYFIYEALMPTK